MMSSGFSLFSYAKVNLFLQVLRKRKDGYHEIRTLFERIDLSDKITFTKIPAGIRITTDSKKIPKGPKNLAYKAAKILKEKYHVKKGVQIRIKKNIPVSAGLGGGSSNAATVLSGLNRLWKLRLNRKQLMKIASELGSDIPFFILNTPLALGMGRGEVLKEIRMPRTAKIWHCLVKPPFGISTKEAYESLKSPLLTPPETNVRISLHSISKADSEGLHKLLVNSLEQALNKRVVKILKIKNELDEQGALASLMSGSGSSVFGIYRSQKEAAKAARFLRSRHKNWQVFVVSTF